MKGVTIEGLKPYDGEYPLDLAHLKAREYGLIKRLSGYLPADLADGLAGLDMELIAAIAIVGLQRAGTVADNDGETQARDVYSKLVDLEAGKVQLDLGGAEEDDAVPPTLEPGESGNSSGTGSKKSSATSTHLPRVGGTHESAGQESQSLRSVS